MSEKSTILTVSQLTFAIKTQLESCFSTIVVSGEITNFKNHSSGHFYFDLKDKGAKIPAVLFKGNQKGVTRLPKEGDQVTLTGSISVYPPHGRYQLIAQSLTFAGVGELLLKFEALKKELAERGWFDKERKKPIPSFPKTIGVVTSPTGAVIQDIIHVLRRRSPGFHLVLYPTRVQGDTAAKEIAEAIETFNKHKLADVLIVGRGGGSLEDLWPFNEEIVAKAIFESEIPIISAVGHETDVTLADYVADMRAPTPSAAAEIVSAEVAHSLEFLAKCAQQLKRQIGYQIHVETQRFDEIRTSLDRIMKHTLAQRKLILQGHKKQADALSPTAKIAYMRRQLTSFDKQLYQTTRTQSLIKQQRLKEVVGHLKALDPKNVLGRGYAILFAQNHDSVIVSTKQLNDGQIIAARLKDGEVTLKVSQHGI